VPVRLLDRTVSQVEALVSDSVRTRLLRAALGFVNIAPQTRELQLLHCWLDSWRGIGDIVAGMARQGYDLQLARYDGRGWRATFYTSGMEHSATSAIGSAWEPTPWTATQRAALEALRKAAT
jgi:hypothetical protein